jgi:hypothetical protein
VIDPISLAVGAGLLAAGALLGRLTKRGGNKPDQSEPKSEPICGCGHSLAKHERDTERCRGEDGRDRYNDRGHWMGHEWVPCTCQRYVGPQPVESLWLPPITNGDGQ